jgi:GT2 family glycosyltransferase
MMARRSFFQQFSFDESFPYPHMEDTYFRERLKLAGERFMFVPAAVIDHPPRRILPGRQWAKTHECEVIYHYKMNEQPPPRWKYVAKVAKARVRNILKYRPGIDSIVAAYNAGVELLTLTVSYNQWKTKNRGLMHRQP